MVIFKRGNLILGLKQWNARDERENTQAEAKQICLSLKPNVQDEANGIRWCFKYHIFTNLAFRLTLDFSALCAVTALLFIFTLYSKHNGV